MKIYYNFLCHLLSFLSELWISFCQHPVPKITKPFFAVTHWAVNYCKIVMHHLWLYRNWYSYYWGNEKSQFNKDPKSHICGQSYKVCTSVNYDSVINITRVIIYERMLTRLATETCHKLTVPSVWCSKKGLVEYSSLCGVAHVILRGSEALLRMLDVSSNHISEEAVSF